MNRLPRLCLGHPRATIAAAALLVATALPGLIRLELRTDGLALVPAGAPAVRADHLLREAFNIEDPLVILLRTGSPGGIYRPEVLRVVRALSTELAANGALGSDRVVSLATEVGFRFRPGTLRFRPLLEPLPRTEEALAQLRDDLAQLQLYTGTLVADDGSATAIRVSVPATAADRTGLCATFAELAAARAATVPGLRADVIGAPAAEALLGAHILADLGVPRALLGSRRIDGAAPAAGDASTAGTPAALQRRIRRALGRHLGLVPLALAVMALVFFLCFGNTTAVVLPLTEVAACLLFVFGWMGWLGVPVYLTIAVLPVVLTAIGVADEVHIFTRYAQLRRAQAPPAAGDVAGAAGDGGAAGAAAVRATMDEMARPVIRTSLTTAAGFLSFAISPLAPVRAFGLLTAAGILFCMLWSLSVIPVLLARYRPPGGGPAGWWPATWSAAALVRRRRWILAGAAVAVLLAPWGVARLRVQDSWLGGFAAESAFYRATRFFDRHFFGTHILQVALESEPLELEGAIATAGVGHHELRLPAGAAAAAGVADPQALVGCELEVRRLFADSTAAAAAHRRGRRSWSARITAAGRDSTGQLVLTTPRRSGSPRFLLRPAGGEVLAYRIRSQPLLLPDVLRRIEALETMVAGLDRYTVGGTLGPARFLATANYILMQRQEGQRRIPDSPARVRLLWQQYERIRGHQRLRQIVDPDFRRTLVTVFLEEANYADTARLMARIREHVAEHLAPLGFGVTFAGDVAVSQALIAAIVTTQVRSLLLSVAGILALTWLLYRSLRWALLAVLPCALAVLFNFAGMGWLGMPLGVATSMFAGMTLGIGVDFAIHLVDRYRLERARETAADPGAGAAAGGAGPLARALAVAGPAILIDGLAVAIGFGVLLLSQVPANARLGGLTVLCILTSLAATLLLLPVLLPGVQPRSNSSRKSPTQSAAMKCQ